MENTKKFYGKKEGYLEVEIWSAEESNTQKLISLCVYDRDIEQLIESLATDPDFVDITKNKTVQEIRSLIEIILCHDLRLSSRKYGITH